MPIAYTGKRIYFTLNTIFHGAIAPAHIDILTLLGGCADTAGVGRIGCIAAFGFCLVVPEDKEAVGAGLKLWAEHRLVGSRVTPAAHAIVGRDAQIIKGTDRLVGLAGTSRILQKVIREALPHSARVGRIDHHQIGDQKQHQACDKETSLHSVSV
jgi:hypothetical protein